MATARGAFIKGDVLAALPARSQGTTLDIRELGGAAPWRLALKGGFGVEQGAEWASELGGETRTPMGTSEGYSSITNVAWGKTEMALALDAAFLRRADITVENAPTPFTPEDVAALFVSLQARGRECLVTLGAFSRRGVLRSAIAVPGRGYSVDFGTNLPGTPGTNLALKLTWEWAGRGVPAPTPEAPATGADVAGQLGAADASFGLALAGADAFDPDALSQISGAIGKVRGQISQLRRTVRQIGALAQAPARLANEALAAARSLGNACNDLDTLLGDTRDAYLALGDAARSTAQALGPRPAKLGEVSVAKKVVRDANSEAIGAACAVFDAIAKRKARSVGVRPGQSLADVAKAQLGGADRWPEIASLNEIAGQVVPAGTYQVDLPPGGA